MKNKINQNIVKVNLQGYCWRTRNLPFTTSYSRWLNLFVNLL